MKKASIFELMDYKKYLRQKIDEGPRGELSRLSEIAGCQRSYLSQVIAGKPHLTSEQAYRLSEGWNHSDLERDYFLTLLEIKKTTDSAYLAYLKTKIDSIRKVALDLGKVMNRPDPTEDSINQVYYSSWLYSALHIATSIDGGMTTSALSQRFGAPQVSTEKILKKLEEFNYVKKKGSSWIFSGGQKHLNKENKFIHQHHMNWRMKAMQANVENSDNGFHFTNIQAISLQDFEKLKEQLLRNLSDFQQVANPSPSEILINFNFDFFRVDSPV